MTDVKERMLPALDDEFAKDVGQFQTLVELRADVHTKLEKMMKDRSDMAVAEQIVEKLNEANPLDVPPSLVEQQARVLEQEVAMQGAPPRSAHHAGAAATMQDEIRKPTPRRRSARACSWRRSRRSSR